MSAPLPLFEIVRTTLGVTSIRNNEVNEIMHNPVGPWAEANALYIEQSRLKQKLAIETTEPLVVFDVGLGAAANALATLHAARGARRPLRLVSFEVNLDLLRFALDHSAEFEHFTGLTEALETLLRDHEWKGDGVHWSLRHGDFLELINQESERAELVFFDPYSPSVNVDMWTQDAFTRLRARCREQGCQLLTYSRATPARVALLTAGFFVGAGQATGLKDETTQAGVRLEDLDRPLDAQWLQRWGRSHTPFAWGTRPEDEEAQRLAVLGHPQFQINA